MRVRCIANRGAGLSPRALARPGQTVHSKFNVVPGREYEVYAMSLSDYALSILIVSVENHRPYWIPVDLFEVTDQNMPDNWQFVIVRNHSIIRALWGYSSLINDPDHHDNLINREAQARDEFLRDNNLRSLEEA